MGLVRYFTGYSIPFKTGVKIWFFLHISLSFKKKKKVGLTFLPITPTKLVEESDSRNSDVEINGFTDPKAKGKSILITKHHHNSSDLDSATITGHLRFHIILDQHSEKEVILLVRVIYHDYQGKLYWCYGIDTKNAIWIPGNS